jgi:hypothetical protein
MNEIVGSASTNAVAAVHGAHIFQEKLEFDIQ